MKKKIWLVRMDNKGRFDVAPGIVKRADGETLFVQIDVEPSPGLTDTIVVEAKAQEAFKNEHDALVAAIQKCHQSAASWLERATMLANRLK